jgi:hypothetical protein
MKQRRWLIGLSILGASLSAQPRYELLIKGGHVIDPKNNINSVMHVAIASGKIARVSAAGPSPAGDPGIPVPAKVRIMPSVSIMRRRLFPRSLTYRLPRRSIARSAGKYRLACTAGPPSPENADNPVPAMVSRIPSGRIRPMT